MKALPSSDPRDIFTTADDFRMAYCVLVKADAALAPKHRLLAPQNTVGAFAVELYLKCLLVDGGAKTVPGTHDLHLLFGNLPKTVRVTINRHWKKVVDETPHFKMARVPTDSDFGTMLSHIADSFDEWRYRFEEASASIRWGGVELPFIHTLLRWMITERHPDWDVLTNTYWIATFPFQ